MSESPFRSDCCQSLFPLLMVVFSCFGIVEPTPGVDVEGLEVARECLAEAFKVDLSSGDDDQVRPDLLVEMFKSLHSSEPRHDNLCLQSGRTSENVSRPSIAQTSSGLSILKSSTSKVVVVFYCNSY